MEKIELKKWKKTKENLKSKFSAVMSTFWEVSKIDVEEDEVTYFKEVKKARVYFDAEKIISKFNLELNEFDFGDCYYDVLSDEIIVRVFGHEDIEKEIIKKLSNLLKEGDTDKLLFDGCLYNTSFNGLSINKYRKNKKIVLLVQDKNYNNAKNYKKLEFEEEAFNKWIDGFDDSPYTTTADLNEKLEIMREVE